MTVELDGAPVTVADLAALALNNYGHFTTMRVEAGRVRGLGLHLERLRRDCSALFDADLDTHRVRRLARRAVGGPDVVVRVTVFDPAVGIGDPATAARPRILVTSRPAPGAGAPIAVRSVRGVREVSSVKHTGLFATVHHRRAACAAGFDDVLFVAPDGRVSEGSTWNVAFVRDDVIVWPAAECLTGVTMRLLRRLLDRLGVRQRTAPVTLADLDAGTAALAMNATMGVRPITAVDGRRLASAADLVAALQREYAAEEGEPL